MSEKPLRIFKKIPVFIVDNHNEVLEFLYKCLGGRYLPFTNNVMIHFDSHPDMSIPRFMPASYVFNKDQLLENVSIENWIMPAVYGGHISQVFWIREHWAKQIAKGSYNFIVGEDADGYISANSDLDYFLCEGAFTPAQQLKNQKSLQLDVMNIKELIESELNLDEASIILDIDLDYFSTHNPFLPIYEKANAYEKLKEFYMPPEKDETNLEDFIAKRNKQIYDLQDIFEYLEDHGSLDDFRDDSIASCVIEGIRNLSESIKHHYKDEKIDWLMIHDGGCTWDQIELPHHESSNEEITLLMKDCEKFLKKLPKAPTIITISRSSEDEYTPIKQVEFIQQSILNVLNKVFVDSIEAVPILWYKGDKISNL